ncbi:MAG: hypothetical protein ACTS6P_02035 [Candidatus Hodgkinia cicadicola]
MGHIQSNDVRRWGVQRPPFCHFEEWVIFADAQSFRRIVDPNALQ